MLGFCFLSNEQIEMAWDFQKSYHTSLKLKEQQNCGLSKVVSLKKYPFLPRVSLYLFGKGGSIPPVQDFFLDLQLWQVTVLQLSEL